MVALLRAGPPGDRFAWREPSAAELAAVTADLLDTPPATAAFPGTTARYLALPQQPFGQPVPRYGPALAARFPDTPIVVMYGSWIEYDGPDAEEFAELTAATFYGRFDDLLSRSAYPQRNVLGAYLNRVADVRYSGLFDRPLPYRPLDPLRVALPALPWLFAACVVVFLLLSVRSVRRPARSAPALGTPARLAELTGRAVEVSLLTTGDPALPRAITKLMAARDALAADLPDTHVRDLLDDARNELDAIK